MRFLTNAFGAFLCLLLTACGGGGGGGGPKTPSGAFDLAGTSATFSVLQNSAVPAAATLSMTITGDKVAYVGAAYAPGQTQPAWLGIDITGGGTHYSVVMSIRSTNLAPGNYTSTFAVGTADSNGSVLRSQNITVNYSVTARLAISGQPQSYSFTYGDAPQVQSHAINVVADQRQWSVTSDSAWLRVSDAVQANSATVSATIDAASLMPGQYQGRVTVTNTSNAQDTATQLIAVTVTAPTFSVVEDALLLGGPDGMSAPMQSLSLSISTGATAHPFAIQMTTDSGGDWLRSSTTSGVVDAGGMTLQMSADRLNLVGGTYTGEVRVTVTVRDLQFTEVLPVTYNVEASRIVVGAAGVALSSSPAPGRSVLTRRINVYSSIDRSDIPWSATSDQSWLSVTASGVTGQAATLTANPSGLATDTTHFATVTVNSGDASVENAETIRVGLHINGVAPVDLSNATTAMFVASSPVEPIVFTNDGAADITSYNVYTGAADRTFTNVVAGAGSMVLSDDGRHLFVFDRTNLRVTQLDATSGALVRHYNSGALDFYTPTGGGMAYFRPAGYPILITPSSRMYDVSSNVEYTDTSFVAPLSAVSLIASEDGRHVVTDSGSVYRMTRTALGGGALAATYQFSTGTAQGRSGQACISADRSMVYTASGAPYEFPGVSMETHQIAQRLPGTNYPNSVLCLWNGVVIGGVDGYYANADVWIYDGPTGVELARRSSSVANDYRSLVNRGMAASGDATRLITLTESSPGVDRAQEVRFQSIPGVP